MMGIAGWFDAFRENGGPTWYGEVRTPATADSHTVSILTVFIIFYAAFLIIFPGIRREKWASFCCVTVSLYIGAVIQFCINHPQWHSGEVRIFAPYRSFTSEKLDAILGVNFGLVYVNVTLRGTPQNRTEQHMNYNERFNFFEVKSMQKELDASLHRGLPYPILSVVEYLSVDRAGFIWGRHYRLAGYYTYILLWLAFSLWILMIFMLGLIPQYFSRTLIVVGSNLWLANLVYILALPDKNKLSIPFPGPSGQSVTLSFGFCACFWIILGSGALCVVMGVVIRSLELYRKDYTFATFLQVDFDMLEIASRKKTILPRKLDNESLETNCNEAGAPHVSCSIDGSFISAATELGSHRASPADIFFENNNNRPSTSADRSLSYQDISPAGGVSQSHKKLPSPNNLSIEMVPQSRRHSSTGLVRAEVEESTSAYLQVHPAFGPNADKLGYVKNRLSSDSAISGKRKPVNSVSQSVSDLFVSGLSPTWNEHYDTTIESTPLGHGHQRWNKPGGGGGETPVYSGGDVVLHFRTDPRKQRDTKRRLYRHSLQEDPTVIQHTTLDVQKLTPIHTNTPVGVSRQKPLGGTLTDSPSKRSTPMVLVTTPTPGGKASSFARVEPEGTPPVSPKPFTETRSFGSPPKPTFPETSSPPSANLSSPSFSSVDSAGQQKTDGRRRELSNNKGSNVVSPQKKLRRIPLERLASADEEIVTTRAGRLTSYHL